MAVQVVALAEMAINGRYSVTVSNFSRQVRTPTTVHKGPYGAFATSKGIPDVSGNFRVSIPVTGFEFDWESEMDSNGSILVRGLGSSFKEAYEGVTVNSDDLSSAIAEGRTEATIGWTALRRLAL